MMELDLNIKMTLTLLGGATFGANVINGGNLTAANANILGKLTVTRSLRDKHC
jgi:hypothetical protein